MTNLIVNGAAGRMGRTLVKLISRDTKLNLAGAVDFPTSPDIGADSGKIAGIAENGVKLVGRLSEVITLGDIVIDFSSANATLEMIEIAKGARKAVVMGTTGHTPKQLVILKKTSSDIPLLIAPNMSVGVNLLWKLTELISKTIGKDYRIDIKETHHVHKKDAPSGTAKKMIDIVRATSKEPDSVESFREGEVVGNHTISFSNEGEVLELSHHAISREVFAQGALKAAKWIVDKPAGLYDMSDVLF